MIVFWGWQYTPVRCQRRERLIGEDHLGSADGPDRPLTGAVFPDPKGRYDRADRSPTRRPRMERRKIALLVALLGTTACAPSATKRTTAPLDEVLRAAVEQRWVPAVVAMVATADGVA